MAYQFLVDVNLPQYFRFFHGEEFQHVLELDGKMPDQMIWEYAKANNLVILSRDTDFYFRCVQDPSVKVIHFALGNIRLKALHEFFQTNWKQILQHLDTAQLIQVTQEEIRIVR
ncbi:MAG: DUF5615 family PIN-like protein [Bacteroidota bacterium]